MFVGIEYADFKSGFDAGDSVLFQGGVYTIHHPSHRVRTKTRLQKCSTCQVKRENTTMIRSSTWMDSADRCTVAPGNSVLDVGACNIIHELRSGVAKKNISDYGN
jgi:hypothetical protein